MADELWGVGPDARRAARPVVAVGALGVAAFTLTFTGALLLGRGFSGSALAALLVPLALSGAMAVGLAVAFVVAVAIEQPHGASRVRRLVPIVTPLAALVALFVYAADPAGETGRPFAGPANPRFATVEPPEPLPPRIVSVPTQPPKVAPPGAVAPPGSVDVLGTRTRRPATVAAGPVAGPVVPQPAPRAKPVPPVVSAPESPPLQPEVLGPVFHGPTVTAKTPQSTDCPKHGKGHCAKVKGKKARSKHSRGKRGG